MNDEPIPVLMVITRLIVGGAQQVLLDLAAGLDPARVRACVAYGPEAGAEGSLVAAFRARGVALAPLAHLRRDLHPAADLRALGELIALIRRRRPAVVHCHTSKAGFVGCLAARLCRVRGLLYSPHGHIFAPGAQLAGVGDRPRWQRALLYRLRRAAEGWAHRVTALNRADLDEQVALGLAPRHKYVLLPNGIDCDRWRPATPAARAAQRAALGLAPDAPVIAAVGRLVAEKGHDLLIEALARRAGAPAESVVRHSALSTQYSALSTPRTRVAAPTLLLIGDGPRRAALAEQATRLGVADRVRFLGLRDDVPALLDAADLVCLPSRYESYGLAAAEAMAKALPVAAAQVGGLGELVADGATGLLVPPEDPAALAEALAALLADAPRRRALGAAGRARVERHFSLAASLRRTEALYAALAGGRRVRGLRAEG